MIRRPNNMYAIMKDLLTNKIGPFVSSVGRPVDGTAGEGALIVGPGGIVVDPAAGRLYQNVGTLASPLYEALSGEEFVDVTLTSAVIKALRATPATLVAAPGVGKALMYLGAALFLDYAGTNVFTESTANLTVKYNNGAGAAAGFSIESTGFIDQATDTASFNSSKLGGAADLGNIILAKAAVENLPLVLHNIGAGEIAGNAGNDNVLRVRTYFAVVRTGF